MSSCPCVDREIGRVTIQQSPQNPGRVMIFPRLYSEFKTFLVDFKVS